MTLLNWILALVALLLWGGTVYWYFRHELRAYWTRRHDKWFRQD